MWMNTVAGRPYQWSIEVRSCDCLEAENPEIMIVLTLAAPSWSWASCDGRVNPCLSLKAIASLVKVESVHVVLNQETCTAR
jgi:hypothetical protein